MNKTHVSRPRSYPGNFAKKVGESYSTVRKYMWIYDRIRVLEIVSQETILGALDAGTLTTTHIRTSAAIDSDEVFMARTETT